MRLSTSLTFKRLLLVYSLGSFIAIIYLMLQCSSDSVKTKRLLERLPEKAALLDQVYQLERTKDLMRQSKQSLHDLEVQLRVKYPQEVALILDQVNHELPCIYAITPTYARPSQKADLTRLAQTLLHVKNLHWILVEDSTAKTPLVTRFLRHSGIRHTHLNATTPPRFKLESTDPNWLKPRGVLQRNAGLAWLRAKLPLGRDVGVVYFMDDDNTYDLRLFEEMRFSKVVGVWPVGIVGEMLYEAPIVTDGRVVGWRSGWKPKERPFAMDMAGFAVNLRLVLAHPDAVFGLKVKRGYQEGTLLTLMNVRLGDLEPLAENCTRVLVWHTRTEKPGLKMEAKYERLGFGVDPRIEV